MLNRFGFDTARPMFGRIAAAVSLFSLAVVGYLASRSVEIGAKAISTSLVLLAYSAVVVVYLRQRSRRQSAAFFVTRVDEATSPETSFLIDCIAVSSTILAGAVAVALL